MSEDPRSRDPWGAPLGEPDEEAAAGSAAASGPGEGDGDADEAAAAVVDDLARLGSERDDLMETLRRVQADFENYRKRVLREQTALAERAAERVVGDLLPVLDSFDAALASAPGEASDSEKLLQGVVGIRAQLVAALERAGLERIEAEGRHFDPNEHEAVLQDDGDGDPVVAEILRQGYRLKGRVLRPAMVRVTRVPSDAG
jgi:molecular chaperone GrpE